MKLGLNKSALIRNLKTTIEEQEVSKEVNKFEARELQRLVSKELDTFTLVKMKIAELVFKEAFRLTPMKTGNLRKSMYVRPYKDGYVVGYDAEYAVYVHEIGFYTHKPPTQYKFLEDAGYNVYSSMRKQASQLGITLNMEYEPLRLFIGVTKAPGKSLMKIKKNEKWLLKNMSPVEFLTYLVEGDLGDEMTKEFLALWDYWKRSGRYSILDVGREYLDRLRH